MFRAINRLFRAIGNAFAGWFGSKADKMQTNKHVMAGTYDKAIDKGKDRYEQVENAVASIIAIKQGFADEVHSKTTQVEDLRRKMQGAQHAMQKRVNELSKAHPEMSKEEKQRDEEVRKHHAAYIDLKARVQTREDSIEELEHQLEQRNEQLATYKLELQKMQRQQQKLKQEKHEALADVAIAHQTASINKALAGIASDTTDQDLQAARDARKQAKAKAQIAVEMSGNDAMLAEQQYAEYASEMEADVDLDAAIDWGEETVPSDMDDAKLSE